MLGMTLNVQRSCDFISLQCTKLCQIASMCVQSGSVHCVKWVSLVHCWWGCVTHTLLDNINSYQSGDISTCFINPNAGDGNNAGLEYKWILKKPDLLCPDPAEPHFEIDYHKMEVAAGSVWNLFLSWLVWLISTMP